MKTLTIYRRCLLVRLLSQGSSEVNRSCLGSDREASLRKLYVIKFVELCPMNILWSWNSSRFLRRKQGPWHLFSLIVDFFLSLTYIVLYHVDSELISGIFTVWGKRLFHFIRHRHFWPGWLKSENVSIVLSSRRSSRVNSLYVERRFLRLANKNFSFP